MDYKFLPNGDLYCYPQSDNLYYVTSPVPSREQRDGHTLVLVMDPGDALGLNSMDSSDPQEPFVNCAEGELEVATSDTAAPEEEYSDISDDETMFDPDLSDRESGVDFLLKNTIVEVGENVKIVTEKIDGTTVYTMKVVDESDDSNQDSALIFSGREETSTPGELEVREVADNSEPINLVLEQARTGKGRSEKQPSSSKHVSEILTMNSSRKQVHKLKSPRKQRLENRNDLDEKHLERKKFRSNEKPPEAEKFKPYYQSSVDDRAKFEKKILLVTKESNASKTSSEMENSKSYGKHSEKKKSKSHEKSLEERTKSDKMLLDTKKSKSSKKSSKMEKNKLDKQRLDKKESKTHERLSGTEKIKSDKKLLDKKESKSHERPSEKEKTKSHKKLLDTKKSKSHERPSGMEKTKCHKHKKSTSKKAGTTMAHVSSKCPEDYVNQPTIPLHLMKQAIVKLEKLDSSKSIVVDDSLQLILDAVQLHPVGSTSTDIASDVQPSKLGGPFCEMTNAAASSLMDSLEDPSDVDQWTSKRSKKTSEPNTNRKSLNRILRNELYTYPLPEGWDVTVVQRQTGASAGKCDVYINSPTGKRLRSRPDVHAYLKENPCPGLSATDFFFTVNDGHHATKRRAAKPDKDAPSPKKRKSQLSTTKKLTSKQPKSKSSLSPSKIKTAGNKSKKSTSTGKLKQPSSKTKPLKLTVKIPLRLAGEQFKKKKKSKKSQPKTHYSFSLSAEEEKLIMESIATTSVSIPLEKCDAESTILANASISGRKEKLNDSSPPVVEIIYNSDDENFIGFETSERISSLYLWQTVNLLTKEELTVLTRTRPEAELSNTCEVEMDSVESPSELAAADDTAQEVAEPQLPILDSVEASGDRIDPSVDPDAVDGVEPPVDQTFNDKGSNEGNINLMQMMEPIPLNFLEEHIFEADCETVSNETSASELLHETQVVANCDEVESRASSPESESINTVIPSCSPTEDKDDEVGATRHMVTDSENTPLGAEFPNTSHGHEDHPTSSTL